ncbi:MAG: FAD-dependent oxidoreductase [Actinomycetes bacterium]
MQRTVVQADVLVVGAGPAGLTAATALREAGVDSVMVIERETDAGGIPRHSDHTGYGLRDLRRVLTGPQYARRLVDQAKDWRVDLRTSTMATDWAADTSLFVTGPGGRVRVEARAVILATGARERSRSARMVPGDRPSGVLTTGLLQSLVHLRHERAGGLIGTRAVVIGAELVSWSAVVTLREAGCETVLMTSEYERPESYAAFNLAGRTALRVPVSTSTRLVRIIGRERVEAVELMRLDTGARRILECDTVVLTGDWVPDNELARVRGLAIDAEHRGPLVDTALRTSAAGIFAAGNLLHPVDTADVAALDGRHVAVQVTAWLRGLAQPTESTRVVPGAGLRWVVPGVIRPGDPAPPRDRVLAWPTLYRPLPRVIVEQGSVIVASRRLPWPASPGRVLRLPWGLFGGVRPGEGEVTVSIT